MSAKHQTKSNRQNLDASSKKTNYHFRLVGKKPLGPTVQWAPPSGLEHTMGIWKGLLIGGFFDWLRVVPSHYTK
jgi:hypothetical protein